MRVYFFNQKKKWWFRSEVYAIINVGWYEKQLLCYPTKKGLYMKLFDYIDRSEGTGRTYIHVIDANRPTDWVRIHMEDKQGQFDRFRMVSAAENKCFKYIGFSWLWEDTETMLRLLNGEAVPVEGSVFEDKLYSDKNTEEWSYIETQEDIERFVNETAGLHDSVIRNIEYTSGAYVDEKGWMLPLDTKRRVSIIFQSQLCREVEMVFEGTIALNLRPAEDNFTSEILGCTLILEYGVVSFFDSDHAMDNYDVSAYDGTCASAYSVKWKFR